jgi:hypothetical protein
MNSRSCQVTHEPARVRGVAAARPAAGPRPCGTQGAQRRHWAALPAGRWRGPRQRARQTTHAAAGADPFCEKGPLAARAGLAAQAAEEPEDAKGWRLLRAATASRGSCSGRLSAPAPLPGRRQRAARLAVCGVHRIYDFGTFCLSWSPLRLRLVTTVTDLAAADLDPRFLHPDLALLPITPMH